MATVSHWGSLDADANGSEVNMPMRIRRYVETDTGHRIPNHESKCRHLHGHRYRFTAEVEGQVETTADRPDEGMLIDFGELAEILQVHVHDVIDHAFIVYHEDRHGRAACAAMGENHRTVVVPFIPTAENLARWTFERIAPIIAAAYDGRVCLVAMHVRETPKSSATWRIANATQWES